ncbi:MAG: MFS transporter [Acidobacteria bacterium]|nr:MAG: MFS transporter [Acidobacteriota bacterium]
MHASTKTEGEVSLSQADSSSLLRTFRALHYRDFRRLWTGLAVSAVGTWMQIVALSLFVLDLTRGSAAALGTVCLTQALTFLLFAAIGGSVADRFDKRRLLLLTQSLMMGFAVLLGILTLTGLIRFWIILLVAFASSSALSFDQPARNALITSLVPKEHLMNAVSLQSAVFNGASILGPALAGLVLSRIGYAGNFFLNAASFLAVLVALLLLRTPQEHTRRPGGRLLASAREALQYVRRDSVLPSVVPAYAALLFFGPSGALALPVFAKEVLHVGPTQLGVLFSAVGAGTVVGALILPSLAGTTDNSRLVFGAILLWTIALAVFGWSDSLRVSVPALFVVGAAQNIAGATTITLLQLRVPVEMRGRAMSLNTLLIMCIRPLGDFPAGAVITWLGFRPTVLLGAALVGAVSLTLYVAREVGAPEAQVR